MNHQYAPVYGKLNEYLSQCQHHDVNFDIAKCLIDKIDDFPNIMIEEIAYVANTTAPTVTKFVKKLGYPSFKAFKEDLSPYFNSTISTPTTIQSFIEKDHQMTIDFFKQLDLEQLQTILKDIMSHSSLIILNSNYTLPFCDQLREIFSNYHHQAYLIHRHADFSMLNHLLKKDSAILIVSLTGQWIKEHDELITQFKQLQIPYYFICPKNVLPDSNNVIPWINNNLFNSYYHSNRYLALLGKSIECLLEKDFPKLENE